MRKGEKGKNRGRMEGGDKERSERNGGREEIKTTSSGFCIEEM